MYQICRVLRVARAMVGVSRRAMAKKLGLSCEHYNNLEGGRAVPGRNALKKIASATHMSLEALLILNSTAPRELDLEHRGMFEEIKSTLMAKFVTNEIFKEKEETQL